MAKYDFSDFEEKPKYDFSDFEEKPSQLESGIRGAAQGALLGFADEATAALESLAGSAGIVPDKTYEQAVAESRANYKQAERANPATYLGGQVAGGVASSLALPGAAATMGGRALQAASIGAAQGYGSTDDRDKLLQNMAMGAGAGAAGSAIGDKLSSGAAKLRDYLIPKLNTAAEKTAIMATGATGKQAAEFAPETGKFLTESNAIGFFDSPKSISRKLSGKMDEAVSQIDEALEANNIQISPDEIAYGLMQKQQELAGYAPTRPMSRELEPFINDYIATMGKKPLSVSNLEQLKRDYYAQIKNFNNPMAEGAKKETANVVKGAVESAMESMPEQSQQFLQAKKAYSILSPVQDAAESRAMQQSQSPFGGLLDIETYNAAGGGMQGAVAGVTRKLVAPRVGSMAHNVTKQMSKALNNPALSKHAKSIQDAISRGPNAAAATDFLLKQTSEEYRKAMKEE